MVDVDRWILELCSLALRGAYYRSRIKIEEILHKFVGMLRPVLDAGRWNGADVSVPTPAE